MLQDIFFYVEKIQLRIKMKKAETRRVREQNRNPEPVGVHVGKNVVKESRPRRPAMGDITNEYQRRDQGLKQKKLDEAKNPKRPVATVRIKPPANKKKTGAPAVVQKTKPASTSAAVSKPPCTSREAPDGAEVPALNKKLSRIQVEESLDLISSSQESTSSTSSSVGDVSMSEAESSAGHDDSRMSLEQSTHESFLMNAEEMPDVPTDQGVEDIDSENKDDITYAALYAHDIFNYYKEREVKFLLKSYMSSQPQLSAAMRAILVDWLVEVQENFELNHETLYLAVKLTDTYLANIPDVPRDQLQLVGAAALFVACKFDERLPPAVEDFLYVCDDAYKRAEFLAMERDLLRTVGFDLGRPISYRFLRRYAKCGRSPVVTLTLARFLLELSLMEYKFVTYRDSLLAASCLYIARRMQKEEGWTPTLEYYSGYKLSELQSTILELNPLFTATHFAHLTTIRAKYNHVVFHSVGKIPPLSNSQLLPSP